MGVGKAESLLQRVPRKAWWVIVAVSFTALMLRTRNVFIPISITLTLIGIHVLPRERAGQAPAIALFVTLALMLAWRLLS